MKVVEENDTYSHKNKRVKIVMSREKGIGALSLIHGSKNDPAPHISYRR